MNAGPARIALLAVAVAAAALALPAAAQGRAGDAYVADQQSSGGNGSLIVIGAGGGPAVGNFTHPEFRSPTGVAVLPSGLVMVVDLSAAPAPGLFQFDPLNAAVAPFRTGPPFVSPRDVARGPDGTLYVTDPGTDTIYKVNSGGTTVAPFASTAAASSVGGIAVARDGSAYVTDRGIPRSVLRVGADGSVSVLATDVLISDPVGITLSPDEKLLYVADIGAGGLIRIDRASGAVSQVAPVADPRGVAVRPDSSLLVTSDGDDSIQRVPFGGGPLSTFSAAAEFEFPDDISVEPPKCAGRLSTVVGTTGPDVLRGSQSRDVISGLGGKDVLFGLQQRDVICGGKGNDVIRGGPGNDRLIGGKGRDRLIGGKGRRDRLKGGPGKDVERQ